MGGEADGELEVRRAVRARVKAGVDVIKIMATGGHMTPGTNPQLPQYTVAELTAAVDEAHRLGRHADRARARSAGHRQRGRSGSGLHRALLVPVSRRTRSRIRA